MKKQPMTPTLIDLKVEEIFLETTSLDNPQHILTTKTKTLEGPAIQGWLSLDFLFSY